MLSARIRNSQNPGSSLESVWVAFLWSSSSFLAFSVNPVKALPTRILGFSFRRLEYYISKKSTTHDLDHLLLRYLCLFRQPTVEIIWVIDTNLGPNIAHLMNVVEIRGANTFLVIKIIPDQTLPF